MMQMQSAHLQELTENVGIQKMMESQKNFQKYRDSVKNNNRETKKMTIVIDIEKNFVAPHEIKT